MLGFAWRRPAASSNPADVTPCLLPRRASQICGLRRPGCSFRQLPSFSPMSSASKDHPCPPNPRFLHPLLPLPDSPFGSEQGRQGTEPQHRGDATPYPDNRGTFPGPPLRSLVTHWAPRRISCLRWGSREHGTGVGRGSEGAPLTGEGPAPEWSEVSRSGFKSWPRDPDRLPDLALSLDFPICKMGIKIISL